MEDIVFGEGLSTDIQDWAVEEDLLGETQTCLCLDTLPNVEEHDPLMRAWYTVMSEVSKLTGLPCPWEETSREDCIKASEAYEANKAELPLQRPEADPASDDITRFVPPTTSGLLSQKISNEQAEPLIHTNPEQEMAARKALQQRNSAARITKRRAAHIERMEKMKRENSQRTVVGIQNLPPFDDYIPGSSLDLAPMHDYCSTASGRGFGVAALDTLEPITYTTLETAGIVHSMQKLQHGRGKVNGENTSSLA